MAGAGISALSPTVGLSGLPDPLGDATAALEARRRQQVEGAGYDPDKGLYDRYSEMLSFLGPTIAERSRAAADAMRRGDMATYQKIATDLSMDFGNFLGSIKPIRAYHGSPHDFDRFSMDKIGSGEGAQAYGHGLYFAENEGVARSYRDALSTGRRGADAPVFSSVGELKFVRADTAHDIAEQGMPALQKRLVALDDDIAFVRRYPGDNGDEAIRHMMQEKDELARLAATGDLSTKKGRMYEVNIHADPERFLDWDKTIGDQPGKAARKWADGILREYLGRGDPDVYARYADHYLKKSVGELLDGDIASWGKYSGDYAAEKSTKMRKMGIPGIKYLDQGSRAAGDGSRNYVVFDDKLIEILRKYGIMAPMAGAGIGSLYMNDEEGM